MNRLTALFVLLAVSSGCADSMPVAPPETETVDLSDEPADSIRELRVRADGMTVWAEPRVLSEDTWLFEGRTSRNLMAIMASIGGSDARVKLISDRKFEVRLTARQMSRNLAGEPLLVEVATSKGLVYTIMLGAHARFGEASGSSKLYPWRNIEPIMVGRETVMRGRVTVPDDFEFVAGWNDDDSEPVATRESETHWTLDWYGGALTWAAHPTEDALELVGDDEDGERFRRSVQIEMEITRLGITNTNPEDAWPAPQCTDATRRCLLDFNVETDDLEACGAAAEVSPCLDEIPVDDTAEWMQTFASDFRQHLIRHYSTRERDIVRAGGNSRTEALRAVDSDDIEEIDGQNDVPSGHSLDDYRVFTHPDVTFPGSDIVWFGVYKRSNGELVEVYDFN